MAFCNSCGTALDAGAKFCPKCGATTAVAGAPAAASSVPAAAPLPVAPPPAKSGSALKIILIIVAIIIGLIIVAAGSCAYFVHRAVTRMHVDQKNGNVSIDTPFGSLNSTSDPAQAAKDTGVDPYPGATIPRGGSANMTIGKMHTATVTYETDDPPSTVADFYKSKLPNATFVGGNNGNNNSYSLMSGTKDDLTTINIDAREGRTKITIAHVTGVDTSH